MRASPKSIDAAPDLALVETQFEGSATRGPEAGGRASGDTNETLAYGSVDGDRPPGAIDASVSLPTSDGGGEPERYEQGALLGRGGMGEVVLQLDRRIGRHVARKTMHNAASAPALARFLREARVQGQLEHPSIVPVYDLGVTPAGAPFFTMKRIRGHALSLIVERLRAGDAEYVARYSRRKLLSAFVQVCQAVEYAHKRGVIHRDLKPDNVMLGDLGEVYVLDWGLARLAGDASGEAGEASVRGLNEPGMQVTRAGDTLGTPLYMAPEQFGAAKGSLGVWSDVFTLGAILFEILTLQPYRSADTMAKLIASIQQPRRERPSERAPGVPPELDELCLRALSLVPDERPGSAFELAEPVERYLEGERDVTARREQAQRLLQAAHDRTAGSSPGAHQRVEAMRDALKVLALTPDDPEAQRRLLLLAVDGSGELPPEAEREFEAETLETQIRATSLAALAYTSWLAGLPISLWFGVRDWTVPLILTALVLFLLGYVLFLRRVLRRRHAPINWGLIPLAVLTFLVISLVSCWLGPFVIVPLMFCGTMAVFVIHASERERPWLVGMACAMLSLPFGVEFLGVLPPAYTFRGGDLVLHARSLMLPQGPTTAVLVYLSFSWVALLGILVGRLRDQQDEGERRLFLQSWYVGQLFPPDGVARSSPPATASAATLLAARAFSLDPTVEAPSASPEAVTDAPETRLSSEPARTVQIGEAFQTESGEPERYEQGALLGRGGMGEVVLQLDRRIGRHVARKTMHNATSAPALARFLREARVQGQLEHPSIVPVYDLGVTPTGAPFFTMKRIRGRALSLIVERLRAGDAEYVARYSRRKLLSAFVQVCQAVEYAHKRGVIHRDLKPDNVMLGDLGEVYVLDWGLARLAGDASGEAGEESVRGLNEPGMQVTRAGDTLGTPLYMAPEQFGAAKGSLGAWSDVFTLGAILFEILTLQPYRRGTTIGDLVMLSLQAPERPSARGVEVPPELDDLCLRTLSREPGKRGTARSLAAELESHLEGDREKSNREALARSLLASASQRFSQGEADAGVRVEAMRDALKALALAPDDPEAQQLLLRLVVDGSGELPPEAEREFEAASIPVRIEGVRYGLIGVLVWVTSFPMALLMGVRSWTVTLLSLGLALGCAAYLWEQLRATRRDRRLYYGHPIRLALVIALVIMMNSAWLGPFILTPLNGSAAVVFFVFHSTRAARAWLIAIFSAAMVVPFGVEFLHLFPPAYSFRAGELVLHARALSLPEVPTLLALASGVSFLVVIGVFITQLMNRKRRRERQMFVQGWHLRQLFPRAAGAAPQGYQPQPRA